MLYWVNFSSDCKSNISDNRPSATLLRNPDHSEPASQYWTAKESLSSCPVCTSSQSLTCLALILFNFLLTISAFKIFSFQDTGPEDTSWGYLCINYLFWNNARIYLNSNTLSPTVHFLQSASFVACASYRHLQAQPHFITVLWCPINKNFVCSDI